MLSVFVPELMKEHNKVYTLLKLLRAINTKNELVFIGDTFSALIQNIPYLSKYEQNTLKAFNIFRNMLVHQNTQNVFTSEHWSEIEINLKAIYNISTKYIMEFSKQIDVKIDEVEGNFKLENGWAELHEMMDEKIAEKTSLKMSKNSLLK